MKPKNTCRFSNKYQVARLVGTLWHVESRRRQRQPTGRKVSEEEVMTFRKVVPSPPHWYTFGVCHKKKQNKKTITKTPIKIDKNSSLRY